MKKLALILCLLSFVIISCFACDNDNKKQDDNQTDKQVETDNNDDNQNGGNNQSTDGDVVIIGENELPLQPVN